jgi:pimeloyl-ACP methyl ester carboxylesterase
MKQIIFQDRKIFYHAAGKGKPVMLLHGFAEDSTIWNYQFKKLKEKFYVIVPDLPGSGKSEMLEGKMSIEDYADVIKAIADAELINEAKNQFTLIGHSMGGYIALAFAQKYPELLNAFGLFHSTAYADDNAKKEIRKKGIEFITNKGVELFLKTTTPNLFSEKTKKENFQLVENLIDNYKDFSDESLIQYYNAMLARPDRTSVLKSFQKPVLFIMGKNDNAVPLQSSLEQCHIPSVSHIKILKNSGHMSMWEQKKESTLSLLKFLGAIVYITGRFTKLN